MRGNAFQGGIAESSIQKAWLIESPGGVQSFIEAHMLPSFFTPRGLFLLCTHANVIGVLKEQ